MHIFTEVLAAPPPSGYSLANQSFQTSVIFLVVIEYLAEWHQGQFDFYLSKNLFSND